MTDDQNTSSSDDALEEARQDSQTTSVGQQPLAEDNDSPAAPASTPGAAQDDDVPATDTDQESSENYEAGAT